MATYTDFFCDPVNGSNMNGGGLASGAEPSAAAVYSATNGGWNNSTGVFTPTSGNPSLTVTVGDFASVFPDGATTPVFVGRVTARGATTVTVSKVFAQGTGPTTSASGRSINVGGRWKGPNAASGFPFSFLDGSLTNVTGNFPRINLKNNGTYSVTASIACNVSSPIFYQGYSSTAGDLGRATISGPTAGASFILLNVGGVSFSRYLTLLDLLFKNNGATGNADGLSLAGGVCSVRRCVAQDFRGNGILLQSAASAPSGWVFSECEVFGANQSATSAYGGIKVLNSRGNDFVRCYIHDNTGFGIGLFDFEQFIDRCVIESNTIDGIYQSDDGSLWDAGSVFISACDLYNNGRDGLRCDAQNFNTQIFGENSNFVKNAGYGVNVVALPAVCGALVNCGYGSGADANTSGTTNGLLSATSAVIETGAVTYSSPTNPYNAPTTGDFRISASAAKGTGRGTFVQTDGTNTGTIAYPDIGAAQHLESAATPGGAGILRSFIIQGAAK
jgi:hypothetical protein